MSTCKEGEEGDLYASIQELREVIDKQTAEIETLETHGDKENANAVKREREQVQERLLAKHQERRERK